MIQINRGSLVVQGSIGELTEDLRDLIIGMTMRELKNKYYALEEHGNKTEEIEELFSLSSLLRMLYTCHSIDDKLFKKLLYENRKIIEEIKEGKFKLIYKGDESDE